MCAVKVFRSDSSICLCILYIYIPITNNYQKCCHFYIPVNFLRTQLDKNQPSITSVMGKSKAAKKSITISDSDDDDDTPRLGLSSAAARGV